MKSKRMAWLVLGAALWLAGYARGASGPVEAPILKLEEERLQAMVTGDLATLDRILADDLTYVHTGGQLESKAEFLARLKSGDLVYKAMRRESVRVRLLGCAAIVTGTGFFDVRSKGQDLSIELRFTDVYVERDGRWQMVAWQSTRVQ